MTEKVGGEKELNFSNSLGKTKYGTLQLILHLIFGWPAYLLSGSTGGVKIWNFKSFLANKALFKKLMAINMGKKSLDFRHWGNFGIDWNYFHYLKVWNLSK